MTTTVTELHAQDQRRIQHWADSVRLEPVEIDCTTAVMLKILDGKCKMNATEKVIMAALYDAVSNRAGCLLEPDVHELISRARNDPSEGLIEEIYEHRVLAETAISRPVMKAFKARLRTEGVLPVKL